MTTNYRGGCGHVECQGLTACIAPKVSPGVAEMIYTLHRHTWAYRGTSPGGLAVMVCDEHDPPEVRYVKPGLPGSVG